MRLSLSAIGRMKKGPETELVSRYLDRTKKAGKAVGISQVSMVEVPESRFENTLQRQEDEMQSLLNRLGETQPLIVFDERGKSISSRQFAKIMSDSLDGGANHMACVIGGPDGHAPAFRDQATHVLSFGGLTMPHQIARILVAEQLYRAITILTRHPYHRD